MTFMELKTAPHLLIFVIVYFGVMIGIGAWASKKIKSSEDYALAGRSLGPFVLMGTLLATSVGSGTITGGGNSLAYNYGYWAGIQWVIPFIVFCIIYMCVYKQIRKSNCFTVPQILQQKYGAETRILGSVINLFGMAGIIASQYKGFGYVLNITTGIDPKTSTVIATIIIIVLSVTGDQNFYTRLTAAKTDKAARNAIIGWGIMALIVMPCVGIIAFTGSVLFGTNIDAGMSFLSTTTIIPAFIGGMLLAASTAFIITTGTSYLLTCGTSVTYDFYKQYINKTPSDSQTLWVNRIGTALIGIIALIILNFFPTILALQNWSYTMIGASITPAVLGSMFSKKVTRPAGFLSMLCGAIATLTWELLGCPGGYQSALIAAPISILVLVIVSACTQKTLAGETA